jgi:hypothetical protein
MSHEESKIYEDVDLLILEPRWFIGVFTNFGWLKLLMHQNHSIRKYKDLICVFFQGEFRIVNLIFNDESLPKSMPRNLKGMATFKAFTNISNTNIEIGKLQVYGEFN